jgi:hypothetical protein
MIIATLAPAVRFLMLKAFTKEGYAELGWILNAMVVAVKEKADVINASFGGCHCRGANECVVCRAANGVPAVVCASAGNAGPGAGTLSCPGAARSAICTASSTRDGGISRFSSRGPSADITNPKPDVTGFGEGVVVRRSARGPNDTPTSGTSFAAPQATAAAACVISAAKSKNRRTDKNQVTTIIRRSARPSQLAKGHRHPDSSGAGMLSIADAVRCVLGKQGLSTRAWFPHSLCRPVPVAAATLALTAVLWWFGLDHANQLSTEHDGPVRLVGRVRTGPQQALVLDDGTDSVAIRWAEADTRPCAGSLIYLLGTWDGQTRSIAGGARFTLWPRQQPCGDSD